MALLALQEKLGGLGDVLVAAAREVREDDVIPGGIPFAKQQDADR